MESRTEQTKPQTTNTNGALSLIYLSNRKNESIGKVKKLYGQRYYLY